MYWIAKSSKTGKVGEPRTASKGSLESPTIVRARGMAPANAIIEELTASQCRLRSVVFYDINAIVEFEADLPGRSTATISGHVASRVSAPPRFTYCVALDRVKPHIAPDVPNDPAPERSSRLRSLDSIKELPSSDGLTRTSQRLPTEFEMQYRTVSEGFKNAKGTNISTGGMLMTCRDALVDGMLLELHFALPSEVLRVYPERTRVFDVKHLLSGRTVPSKLRKPFNEMLVCARVIFHEPVGGGYYQYGLKFSGLERAARDDIARYVDALKHVKTRKTS